MKACTAALSREETTKRIELFIFLALLLCINIPLFQGQRFPSLSFVPDRVAAGEWWRILTHPFAHVSWYHLLIDASAFLFLYRGLIETSWRKRAMYAAICALGSLSASMLSPAILTGGLCGLSGAAHGLMAVSALEMACIKTAHSTLRRAGIIALCVVVAKSMFEAITGNVVLSFLHIGDVGTPLTLSHAGGALAGIVAFAVLNSSFRETRRLTWQRK